MSPPEGSGALAAAVVTALVRLDHSLAVAESLTGGLVMSSIVGVPGASRVLRGGIVAYDTDVKRSLLGVNAELLAAGGPVQGAVALAMASGARARLSSTWGVATTGVAGPDPVGGCPPGTVYVALDGPVGDPGRADLVRLLRLDGDRAAVRQGATDAALALLLAALEDLITAGNE